MTAHHDHLLRELLQPHMLVWLDLVGDSETVVLPWHLQLLAEKLLEAMAVRGVIIFYYEKAMGLKFGHDPSEK